MVYKVWADSSSKVEMPMDVVDIYNDLEWDCDVARTLAHEHDGKPYRAIFHVEDLTKEETIETFENSNNPCDV